MSSLRATASRGGEISFRSFLVITRADSLVPIEIPLILGLSWELRGNGALGGPMSGVAGGLASQLMQYDLRPSAAWRRPLRIERRWDRFRCRSWFRDKDLTSDFSSGNFTLWRRVFSPLRDEPLRILEIGSWEGRSAIFFLNFFANATITCIDTFSGGSDHQPERTPPTEERFDRNLAAFGARVEKIKGP